MKLRVGGYSKSFIHCGIDKMYLRKDGTIGEAYVGKNENFWSFKSQQEAQQFLDNWMPKKERLPHYDVQYYSTLGEQEALDCSIEHWKQNVLDVENAHVGSSYCAICLRAENKLKLGERIRCPYCILNNYTKLWGINCCKEYQNFVDNKTEENAIAMLNKLVLIRNKKYGIAKQSGNPYDADWESYLDRHPGICDKTGSPYREEKKMSNKIVFDDGKEVELSKETTERLRKELVKPEPYQFKAGDVAVFNPYGSKRIVLNVNGELCGFDTSGNCCTHNVGACSYEKIGELKDFIK
jgi:hypothetical protein